VGELLGEGEEVPRRHVALVLLLPLRLAFFPLRFALAPYTHCRCRFLPRPRLFGHCCHVLHQHAHQTRQLGSILRRQTSR